MLPTLRKFFRHVAPKIIGEYGSSYGANGGSGKKGGSDHHHHQNSKSAKLSPGAAPTLLTIGSLPKADRRHHRGGGGGGGYTTFDAHGSDEYILEEIKDISSQPCGDLEAGQSGTLRPFGPGRLGDRDRDRAGRKPLDISRSNSSSKNKEVMNKEVILRDDLHMGGVETKVVSGGGHARDSAWDAVRALSLEHAAGGPGSGRGKGSGDNSPRYPIVTTRITVTYDEPGPGEMDRNTNGGRTGRAL